MATYCLASLGGGSGLVCLADLEPGVAVTALALSAAESLDLAGLELEDLREACRVAIELRRRKREYEEVRERDHERAVKLVSELHELLGELHSIAQRAGEGVVELVELLAEMDLEREVSDLVVSLRRGRTPEAVERLLRKFEEGLHAVLEALGVRVDIERESRMAERGLREILARLERAGILEGRGNGIYARLEIPRTRLEFVRLVDERGLPTRPLLAVIAASELREGGFLLLSWELPPPTVHIIEGLLRVALGRNKIQVKTVAPVLYGFGGGRAHAKLEFPIPEASVRRAIKYFLLSEPLERPLVLGGESLLDAALNEFRILEAVGLRDRSEAPPRVSEDLEAERSRLLRAIEEARERGEPYLLVKYLREVASRARESSGEAREARLAILREGGAALGF